jgi:hypothetical protein
MMLCLINKATQKTKKKKKIHKLTPIKILGNSKSFALLKNKKARKEKTKEKMNYKK